MRQIVLQILLLGIFSQSAICGDVVSIASYNRVYPNVRIFVDPSGTMKIDSLVKDKDQFREISLRDRYGYSFAPHFYIFTARNDTSVRQIKSLAIENRSIRGHELYIFDQSGNILPKRDYNKKLSPFPVHNITFEPKSGYTFLVKVNYSYHRNVNIYFDNEDSMGERLVEERIFVGMFCGICIGLLMYNLFISISLRDKKYFWYCLFILLTVSSALIMNGYWYMLLFTPKDGTLSASLSLTMGTAAIFVSFFLNSRERYPFLHGSLYAFSIASCLASALLIFWPDEILCYLTDVIFVICGTLIMTLTIIENFTKDRLARYFLYAWAVLFSALAYWTLATIGLAGENDWNYMSINAGISLAIVLLSVGLGEKIEILRRELIKQLAESNDNLEECVIERTSVILKQQEDLIAATRFASIGEISSGIAHEIRNPIAIAKGNAEILGIHLKEKGYLNDKITMYLEKIDNNLQRVERIIKSLLSLSRKDQHQEFKQEKLLDIIRDVLEVAQDKLKKHNVNLIIDPKITEDMSLECYTTQISQVIMILISNAIDAIGALEEKWVKLDAKIEDASILVSVEDSGNGIPEDMRNSLFEIFFTTKPAGKGTGLGLSIAKRIVESHQGEIFLDPESKHTKFVVRLPLVQRKSNAA
ncbi:MAG: sensor histidine kinase [Oligoflexales bacterium]|nr:sensor histidine kinase [Oligoflexales bacterium]